MTKASVGQGAFLDIGEPAGPALGLRAGWTRVDPRPWTKCRARWVHASGWKLNHCGHPTALRPWALYAPDGRMVLRGAEHGDPTKGAAWERLDAAMALVARVLAGGHVLVWPVVPSPA